MLPRLLQDVRFYAFRLRVDLDLTLRTRLAGCPLCGCPLRTSRFRRKLRGVPMFGTITVYPSESTIGVKEIRVLAVPDDAVPFDGPSHRRW